MLKWKRKGKCVKTKEKSRIRKRSWGRNGDWRWEVNDGSWETSYWRWKDRYETEENLNWTLIYWDRNNYKHFHTFTDMYNVWGSPQKTHHNQMSDQLATYTLKVNAHIHIDVHSYIHFQIAIAFTHILLQHIYLS